MDNEETKNAGAEAQNAEQRLRDLEAKLARVQKDRAVFAVKSKLLGEELAHYRNRESREHSLVDDLLERQRELNVMLNRSNILLARAQDATAMLSLEFGELARALPETVHEASGEVASEKVEERVQKINDLFRKTGQLAEELKETLHDNAETQRRVSTPRASEPDAQSAAPTPQAPASPGSSHAEPQTDSRANGSAPHMMEAEEPEPQPSSVFQSWAVRTDEAGSQPEDAIISEIATEQERADIEAALGQQGIWRKLKGKFSR